MKESTEFYNKFDKKLIEDYVFGNQRIKTAIIGLGMFIPENSISILDIGCGLGWSSYEFSKHFPNCIIEGVDLSPVLIENARKLFNNNNLNYKVYDVTQSLPDKKYDAIIMIDVYEHIPISERANFNRSLKKLLKEQGRLILACPSKHHQLWLKDNNPEGLQPIDEDVDNGVVLKLAEGIGGEIIYFEYQNVWQNFDYLYAVIEIQPKLDLSQRIKSSRRITLENKLSRHTRVKEKLNLEFKIPVSKKKKKSFFQKVIGKVKKIYS